MSNYVYQNVSEGELTVIGFGVVAPGGEITTDTPVENPSLRFVREDDAVEITAVAEPVTDMAAPTARIDLPNEEQ